MVQVACSFPKTLGFAGKSVECDGFQEGPGPGEEGLGLADEQCVLGAWQNGDACELCGANLAIVPC